MASHIITTSQQKKNVKNYKNSFSEGEIFLFAYIKTPDRK